MSKRTATNRHAAKAHAARDTARQIARARRREPVDVRFVCPLCGGPHSRAEHS